MIVAFRRPFWDGERLHPRNTDGVEISDEWEGRLPSTATILSAVEAKKKRKRTIKEKEDEEASIPRTLSDLAKSLTPTSPEA